MWVLSHITTGARFYLLTNSKKYNVGRIKQNELFLPDDTSVSREHAVIYRSSSGVRVEDTGSKYGVYVNSGVDTNKPIDPKTPVELQTGHIVRFGRLGNTFRLENIPFTVCTSAMIPPDLDKLKKLLKLVDGTLQSEWSTECTHLVMKNVTVTVKVLQSLAQGIPIVSPQYFEQYIDCVTDQRQDLPDVNQFIPDITEPYIIKEPGMMEVHLDRQRLFQNKTFVFMVKRHMAKFESIIKLAGGQCINIEDGNVRMQSLLKPEYIPVQYTPTANTQCSTDIAEIEKYIENERRLIKESEIGLAIIHRATDRFCNPDRKMMSDFKPSAMDTNIILKNVLTEETPHTTSSEKSTPSSVVVPESVELTGTEPNNNLRNVEAIDLNKPSTSKVSTEVTAASSRRSTRSSTKGTDVAIVEPFLKPPTPKKIPTPKKVSTPKNNQKRKNVNEEDQQERVELIGTEQESMPRKKQKTQESVENQGETTSSLFVEPLPSQSQSQSDHNFSGFISTQNRKRKTTQDQSHSTKRANMSETSEALTLKRAISMLTADSDEEEDNDRGIAFNFSRKSKRTKITSAGTTQRRVAQRNILDDSDGDDEDGCGFNFSKKPLPKSQAKQKSTQEKSNEKDTVDGMAVTASQNSYRLPFRPSLSRSFNRTLKPVDITFAPKKCDTNWITLKLKNELNLNETNQKDSTPISDSVKIKDEKLEEWELTDEERKKQWIKSLSKVFEIRKVQLNITHRSMADETDGSVPESENASLNKSKNFKRFVKKNNFIPRTVVIKTNTVPVVLSKFVRA